jgi:hypothetical protein
MFRTVGDGPSPWESLLPPELLRLPEELARVGAAVEVGGGQQPVVRLAWLPVPEGEAQLGGDVGVRVRFEPEPGQRSLRGGRGSGGSQLGEDLVLGGLGEVLPHH